MGGVNLDNQHALSKIVKFASGFPVSVTKMFTLVYGQQFPKLLVYKLVSKILETVVHTQEY